MCAHIPLLSISSNSSEGQPPAVSYCATLNPSSRLCLAPALAPRAPLGWRILPLPPALQAKTPSTSSLSPSVAQTPACHFEIPLHQSIMFLDRLATVMLLAQGSPCHNTTSFDSQVHHQAHDAYSRPQYSSADHFESRIVVFYSSLFPIYRLFRLKNTDLYSADRNNTPVCKPWRLRQRGTLADSPENLLIRLQYTNPFPSGIQIPPPPSPISNERSTLDTGPQTRVA